MYLVHTSYKCSFVLFFFNKEVTIFFHLELVNTFLKEKSQKLKKLKRKCVECNKFYIPTNTQRSGKKQIYCSLNCHQKYRKKLGKIKRLPLIIKRKQVLIEKKEKYISSIIKNKDEKLKPYLDKLKKLKKFKNELKSKKTKEFFEMSVHKQDFGNINHLGTVK